MKERLWLFEWDIPRWRSSQSRRQLSGLGRYVYMELCAEIFAEGSAPDDLEECASIVDLPVSELSTVWAEVRRRLHPKNGKLRNALALFRRKNVALRRRAQRESGRKGGMAFAKRFNKLQSKPRADKQASLELLTTYYIQPSLVQASEVHTRESDTHLPQTPESACALPDSCKVRIFDRYPGVKTDDDLRLVLSLCQDWEHLERMAAALDGWIASGRWREARYIPHMRRWLGCTNGASAQCWTIPPKVAPAKQNEPYSEFERIKNL